VIVPYAVIKKVYDYTSICVVEFLWNILIPESTSIHKSSLRSQKNLLIHTTSFWSLILSSYLMQVLQVLTDFLWHLELRKLYRENNLKYSWGGLTLVCLKEILKKGKYNIIQVFSRIFLNFQLILNFRQKWRLRRWPTKPY
jgi:hypothetical protein